MNEKNFNHLELAVVGMACRFPGAGDVEAYWENLKRGVESITFLTDEELLDAQVPPEVFNHPDYVKAASILKEVDCFDAGFFGYSPREAALLDPQQRLFLETAWHALENAGIHAESFKGAVGVFAGTNFSSYLINNLLGNRRMNINADGFFLQIANDKDNLATRTSYKLNLNGPSVTLQTACSTSLVAVHYACQSLLNYESDVALAGGVSVRVPQKAGYTCQDEMIFSRDGHCRPFDAAASGTIFGSGVGAVVLKRLEDALENGDDIYAVIKGSAVNNDGAAKIGFTAPGRKGQEQVIKSALAMADVSADTIGAVENHGTGTILGDPLEIEALSRVWMSQTREKHSCAIGSVKSNFGHLECSAGIASFIKMCLCLKNKWLVPTVNFENLNPHIHLEQTPFYVNVESKPWKTRNGKPLRGCVSSFGIGGTNAHVVLEAPGQKRKNSASRPVQLLLLSARTEGALEEASRNLLQFLKTDATADLADIAHTLRTGRTLFRHRRSIVCRNREAAAEALAALDPQKTITSADGESRPKVVFMFPGQGSQYVGMGREVYTHEAFFRQAVDHCAELLKPHMGMDIREVVFGDPDSREAVMRLNRTDVAQPALFVVEYALAKLFISWGISPQWMIGHSIGEYVAACLSGVLCLEDALFVVARRARLMNAMPEGEMAAVNLPHDQVAALLPAELSIAAVNGPSLTVVSGPAKAVRKMEAEFAEKEARTTRLHTSHAFHSRMMAPCAESLAAVMGGISCGAPGIAYISNLTGEEITDAQTGDPRYWADHMLHPVRFAPGIDAIKQREAHLVFLEVGPGRTLGMLARNCDRRLRTVSSLPHATARETSSLDHMIGSLGKLWTKGVIPDWRAFNGDEIRNVVHLPGYPFERRRYWVEPTPSTAPAEAAGSILLNLPMENAPEDRAGRPVADAGPASPLEKEIAILLQNVLGVEKVGVRDDFLDLGGHSLLATQFLDQLNKKFGTRIKLNDFFAEPTVAGLVRRMGGQIPVAGPSPDPADDLPAVIHDPGNRFAPYPLREMQQAQWIGRLGNFSMSNVAAHVYFEAEKEGLDPERLHASWQNMIKRHETLRGIILPEGGQKILPEPGPYAVRHVDLQNESPEKIEKTLLGIRSEMDHVMRPTDQWPLFEVRTSRLPGSRIRIHFSIDLLICDVSSLRILLNEWAADYLGETLPDLELSFRDYVIAEEKIKETERFNLSARYWDERIQSLPPAPQLPLARNPNEIARPRFKRWSTRLEREKWEKLKAQAVGKRISASIALLTAFGYVLGNWSKSQRFCLNTTIINRMAALHPQANQIIGEFSSFAPVEVHVQPRKSFSATAAEVMAQNLINLEHRYVSGVSVLRKLAQRGGATTGSVLPVVFTSTLVQELDDRFSRTFGGFDHVISQTPQVWLDHCVLEDEYGLVLSWHAVEGLFPEGMIDTMWRAYETLIDRLATDASAWQEPCHLLLPAEQQQARRDVNTVPAEIPDTLLQAPFYAQARSAPQRTAVIAGDTHLTYGQTADFADRLAGALHKDDLQAGEVVAIVMEKGWPQIVSALGILQAGGVYLGIDPHLPAQRLAYLLETTDVKTVLTTADLDRDLTWPGFVARRIVGEQELGRLSPCQPKPNRHPEDLAYIIFTSGSTGQPKGVMVSHRSALNTITDMNRRFDIDEDDRVLGLSELNFDLSVYDLFGILAAGGALVLPAPGSGRDPQHWLELVAGHGVTLWNSVPAFVEMFVEYAESRASDLPLRHIWMSGDWIPVSLPARIRRLVPRSTVVSLGGATEAAIWSIIYVIDEVRPEWVSIPYGKPLANQQIHVLNENLDDCPVHVPGEIYIGGIGVAMGYWKDEEKTRKAFITHPRSGRRLYRTGDFGRYLPDGNVEFLGREDLQIKISGFRIELGEIEAALAQCPNIHSAVVNAWEPAPGNKRLVGYVIPEEGVETDAAAIQAWLADKLPHYMIPGDFVLLDMFPLNANGKVDRKALPAPHRKKKGGARKAETDVVIQRLIPIFKRVLGVDDVDIHENFFAMGGDSIRGIRIINEAAEEGIEIAPQQLFEKQTIADLAEVLEVALPAKNTVQSLPKHQGAVPLSPHQHWFFRRYRKGLERMNRAMLVKVAVAMKPELIESAFRYLVGFHDALQLCYVRNGDGWRQAYHEQAGPAELDFVDVTGLVPEAFAATVQNFCARLENMQDIEESPLLKLCLFQDRRSRISHLLLVAHELIMDDRSMHLFFQDLCAAYRQLETGSGIEFPQRVTFKALVTRPAENCAPEEGRARIEQFRDALPAQSPPIRLAPAQPAVNTETTCSVRLDTAATRLLLDESLSIYRTCLDEFLIMALAFTFIKGDKADALYLDWMARPGEQDLEELGATRTIGNLARPCPLHLEMDAAAGTCRNIQQLKERIRWFNPGDGAGCGDIPAQAATKALPEILFHCRPEPGPDPFFEMQWTDTAPGRPVGYRPYALEIHAGMAQGCLQVQWTYDARRFSGASVRETAGLFMEEVMSLIGQRHQVDMNALSASDFRDADVNQEELEKLFNQLK